MSLKTWIFQINPEKYEEPNDNYTIYDFQAAVEKGEQLWSPHAGSFYKEVNIGDTVLIRHVKNIKNSEYVKWTDTIVGIGKITKIPLDIDENFLISFDRNLSLKLVNNPLPCNKIDEYIPKMMMNKTIIPIEFPENKNFNTFMDIIKRH